MDWIIRLIKSVIIDQFKNASPGRHESFKIVDTEDEVVEALDNFTKIQLMTTSNKTKSQLLNWDFLFSLLYIECLYCHFINFPKRPK